jgi:uncharacterized membrane protein YhiD involved in acid resistance
MQLDQLLKSLQWSATEASTLPAFAINLVVAAALASLLGLAYIQFGQSLSNRRVFARNFLMLTLTTTLVITIVKSSLTLSLGLVGALSIVRFRAAIKEPEELGFLFLAIGIGLGLGAGQALVTVVALVLIIGLLAIRYYARPRVESPNLFVTVTAPGPQRLTATAILGALTDAGATASLKRFDETPEQLEASFQVSFKQVGSLEQASQRLRELCEGVRISCLEERGLGI